MYKKTLSPYVALPIYLYHAHIRYSIKYRCVRSKTKYTMCNVRFSSEATGLRMKKRINRVARKAISDKTYQEEE
jgi:hypothetical protein